MIRDAGKDASTALRIPLKNFFARKGYIYEKRVDGGDVILQITLGSKNGAKEGNKVEIYTIKENKNPLTDEVLLEETKIASAVITNKIRPNSSWIMVKDIKKGEKIKMGDFIKIKYSKGLSDYANDAGKLINSAGIMNYAGDAAELLMKK